MNHVVPSGNSYRTYMTTIPWNAYFSLRRPLPFNFIKKIEVLRALTYVVTLYHTMVQLHIYQSQKTHYGGQTAPQFIY